MKNTKLIFIIATVFLFNCTEDPIIEKETVPGETSLKSAKSIKYVSHSSFVNSLSSYGFKEPDELNFNRTASKSGYNSVYGFNIPSANQVTGFKWNSGDTKTTQWVPQGITGFSWNGKKYLLVAWYHTDGYKGSRIALADITNMNNIRYRLILLAQKRTTQTSTEYTQLNTFRPVRIHAGGMAYYAGKLFVASTNLGIRVFDLSKIIEITSSGASGKCGETSDGTLYGFTYRYILPQIGYYNLEGGEPFSCLSLSYGSSASDRRLVTGQYLNSGSPVMYSYKIDANGNINTSQQPGVIDPVDKYGGPIYCVQGVFTKGNKNYLVHTGQGWYKGSTARLSRYEEGKTTIRYRWPHGAEDLYWDKSTGYLWNCTEYATSQYGKDNRCVFAVRLSDYD